MKTVLLERTPKVQLFSMFSESPVSYPLYSFNFKNTQKTNKLAFFLFAAYNPVFLFLVLDVFYFT